MAIAILGSKFHNDDGKVLTLESGSLRYIDSITKDFKSVEDLKAYGSYHDKISSYSKIHQDVRGEVVLTYIRNNAEKIQLDLLLNDDDTVRTRTSSLEEVKSETENARKLLLNSKNQIFLTSFLLNKNLKDTTVATVKMTIEEFKIAKKEGYEVKAQDGEYRISIQEVLRYRLNHKKLGPMRLLVEDSLEVWKKNMLSLNDEDLYFYSRELRLLMNEYHYRKIPRRAVYNLSFQKENIPYSSRVVRRNTFSISKGQNLLKRKVLEDRKAA